MHGLTLSGPEVARLARVQHLLLSPLDFATPGAWRAAVVRDVGALVGADHGGFALADGGAMSVVAPDVDPGAIEAYRARYWSQDDCLWRHLATGRRCVALSRPMLWPEAEVRRTEFWSDWVVPHRMHEPLALAVAGRAGAQAGGMPELALLSLMYAAPQGWSHAERGVPMLALLAPAFEAGVGVLRRLALPAAALAAGLDAHPGALALADGRGRVVHENTRLASALRADPEAGRVRDEVRRVAAATAQATAGGGARARGAGAALAGGTPVRVRGEVRTTAARYRVGGGATAHAALTPARVAVTVDITRRSVGGVEPVPEGVRERYGFTAREAEVARLLGCGAAAKDVAGALGISVHTARRHTERVFRKMEVRSRATVAARLALLQ